MKIIVWFLPQNLNTDVKWKPNTWDYYVWQKSAMTILSKQIIVLKFTTFKIVNEFNNSIMKGKLS